MAEHGPAGWYPDPYKGGRNKIRYWDGEKWTNDVKKGSVAPPPPPSDDSPAPAAKKPAAKKKAAAKSVAAAVPPPPSNTERSFMDRVKEAPTWVKVVVPIVVLFVVIAAVSPSEEDSSDSSDDSEQVAQEDSAPDEGAEPAEGESEEPESCGTEASDDCTPHVGPNGEVRVDALIWRVTGAKATQTIGDTSIGLGEEADGTFVVVDLAVTSDKDESETVNSDIIQLEVEGGNTYDTDTSGQTAVELSGEKSFFLEDIGPDATLNGTVVFDVPKNVLNQKLEVKFAELGFGSTEGYIALPPL